MTARKQRMAAKEARTRQKRQTDRREEEKVPPMPKGSRRDGIPDRGPGRKTAAATALSTTQPRNRTPAGIVATQSVRLPMD